MMGQRDPDSPRISTPALGILVAVLLTVLALVGVVGVFVNGQANTRHLRESQAANTRRLDLAQAQSAHRIVETAYVLSIKRWHEVIAACEGSVGIRRLLLRAAKASVKATLIVAHAPRQPRRTRVARLYEAQALKREIHGLRLRVPPQYSCARANPKPRVPVGVRPLT
ncbi:hypothetical protein NBH00_05125 [Paraconexibacter antarcticus]|uniref:Uncharacterized protein n=1 Tax=Paraconexibacter antarcticus TaxID=2949664 RepID=A0ABY5DY53_9ACTN|nr:hypothetical protein [Paraconexibacter antarcticus]UTI65592.1 hypothetical protein NBH00_05125 [Paraconexibacter antarcticus]